MSKPEDEFKIVIQDESGKEYNAVVGTSNPDTLGRLFSSLSDTKPVNLKINAKSLEGEIRDMVVIDAEEVETSIAESTR